MPRTPEPDLAQRLWAANAPLEPNTVLLGADGTVWQVARTPDVVLLRTTQRLWAPGSEGWNRVSVATFVELCHESSDRFLIVSPRRRRSSARHAGAARGPGTALASIRVATESWIRAQRPAIAALGFETRRGRLPNLLERFEWIRQTLHEAETEVNKNPHDEARIAVALFNRLVDSYITVR